MSVAHAGTLLGGRYLLERPIAEGGMGAVWRARHLKLDVPVAVKLMAPELTASSQARARFEREAKAAAKLTSPHVVEVHDYGVEGDAPYIVMEHLEGEDLAARIAARGRLYAAETAEIVDQIARALEVAHAAGVVHRDLKPANVFIARTGRDEIVKVLDFGVAKLRAEPGTLPGMLMGSPSYMSPEQARGEGALDHRSDLWSLGVLAFQCLTGRLPFENDDVTALILAICSEQPPTASSVASWIEPRMDRFFERALARSAAERFQSAADLAGAFNDVCGVEPRSRAGLSDSRRTSLPPASRGGPAEDATLVISGRARAHHGRDAGTPPPASSADAISKLSAAPEEAPKAGEVIAGRFEVVALAGEGAMGIVLRARDRVGGGFVALKLVRAAASEIERFFQEARALADVRHPGVVRYVAHGVTPEGRPYLAMEWIEGVELAARLREGPLGEGDALALGIRLAGALGAAHRAGVVHGDLSPQNILLPGGKSDEARIIDFGISRSVRRGRSTASKSGSITGTPGYMAPEQALGEADIDARADVFALGCLLFECLTGYAPFAASSPLAAAGRVTSRPTPKARDLAPSLPESVDEVLTKLLSKDRDGRPVDGSAASALLIAASASGGQRARSKEGLTTSERKLLPAILLAVESAKEGMASTGLRRVRPADSEDATWDVSTDTVALADRLGPIARRFQARVEIVQTGVLAAWIDGAGLLADQATQAALCALALRSSASDLAIAIATGRRGEAGDVLDRAAACLCRARRGPSDEPAAICVDDATFGLLEGRFDITRGELVHLLHGRPRSDDDEGRLLGKSTPCAGREPELGMLDALLRECFDEPAAKAVILKGPAGAGKSRLRRELLRRVAQRGETMNVWIGRGDVMNAGSPFAILANAILSALGLSGGEPDDERRERLRARVAERVPSERQEHVALFLGEMIGIPFPGEVGPEILAAREDALLLGDQRRRAFEDFLAAEASTSPVVLVLEDLHLGDLPTIKLIDAALRALSDQPFFVLATARPSIDDLFPRLWEERVPQEIRVGPLSAKASEKIVRSVLGVRASAELVGKIVLRAAGHPLHLEEIVRAVAEGPDRELPDTVLAVVEARLADLDPAARLVLRAASIFGRTFWDGAVSALTSLSLSDVRGWLRELCEHEWITRATTKAGLGPSAKNEARSRFPGEIEHTIAQDLVQEAAYAMLTESDRARGHRLAAEWLTRAGERDPIVLARHFELGGDRAKAAVWLLRAAEQALEGNDFESAVRHAERSADLSPLAAHRGRALAVAAEAHLHRGELEAARRAGASAIESLSPLDPGYFRACGATSVAAGKLGDIERVAAVARALLALDPEAAKGISFATSAAPAVVQLVIGGNRPLAEELFARLEKIVRRDPSPEPLAIAQLERAAGALDAFAGDLFGSITHQRASVLAFEAAGDLRTACSLGKTLGWYLGELGALEEAERTLRGSITTAALMGLTNLAPHAKHDLGSPLLRLGKLDEARTLQQDALVAFAAQGDRRLESSAHALLSGIDLAAGRLADAERSAEAALASALTPPIKFTALVRRADVFRATGRYAEALAETGQALALLDETGTVEECFVLCLLVRAQTLLALGRDAEADAALARARTEIEGRAAQIKDPDLRSSFVRRIPENARVLEMVLARSSSAEAPEVRAGLNGDP